VRARFGPEAVVPGGATPPRGVGPWRAAPILQCL